MKFFFLWVLSIMSTGVLANASKFEVAIVDLTNMANNTALEACGTAKHIEGKKPLLVTLSHDKSKYTTLTDESGTWCIVFKRWNYNGKITVQASTLDFSEKSGPALN